MTPVQRWLGLFVIAMTASAGSLAAQSTPSSSTDAPRPFSIRQAIATEAARQAQAEPLAAPQQSAKKPITRGKKMAMAAAIAGGIATAIGFAVEDSWELPRGTGALLFGGIGAGTGALIGWRIK